jgi:hypothetical protein
MFLASIDNSLTDIYLSSVWVWNLVSDIKRGTQTEGVWEQGAEENIWAQEGWTDKSEKTA